MKKYLLFLVLPFIFISCSRESKKNSDISLWQFFPNSKIVYDGGFEGTNYIITSEKIGDELLLQKVEGSAMILTKVIKITSDEAKIIFIGEEGMEYQEGVTNRSETLIKKPLEAGNSWSSDESTFTIASFDGKILVVNKTFDDTSMVTSYEIGVGMVSDSFSSGNFNNISKLVERHDL